MRLIKISKTGSLRLGHHKTLDELPPYAILSHTWEPDEEVSFQDLVGWKSLHKKGWEKIRFCQKQAPYDGLHNFWVDSCCIDKEEPNEKHDAFDSMFSWYATASICYVFLNDVLTLEDLPRARWWRRGWTLQELLAPKNVTFFSAHGEYLGSKVSLEDQIYEISGIDRSALRGSPLSTFSFNERLAWMKWRVTTFDEDYAYCLQGILGVKIPRQYGERVRQAIQRLRDAAKEGSHVDFMSVMPPTRLHSKKNSKDSRTNLTMLEILIGRRMKKPSSRSGASACTGSIGEPKRNNKEPTLRFTWTTNSTICTVDHELQTGPAPRFRMPAGLSPTEMQDYVYAYLQSREADRV